MFLYNLKYFYCPVADTIPPCDAAIVYVDITCDTKVEEEKEIMRAKEENVLNKLKIVRE